MSDTCKDGFVRRAESGFNYSPHAPLRKASLYSSSTPSTRNNRAIWARMSILASRSSSLTQGCYAFVQEADIVDQGGPGGRVERWGIVVVVWSATFSCR
jgi:hypothetical protein